jgi:hypothetical protein
MARTPRPKLSDEELVDLFSAPRSAERLIEGLRAIGFTAESIARLTSASTREAIYAWSSGRSFPSRENAEQLDRLRSVVSWISRQPELGPRAVWLTLNGWPGGLDPSGPTALTLLANERHPDDWKIAAEALDMALGDPGSREALREVAAPPAPAPRVAHEA